MRAKSLQRPLNNKLLKYLPYFYPGDKIKLSLNRFSLWREPMPAGHLCTLRAPHISESPASTEYNFVGVDNSLSRAHLSPLSTISSPIELQGYIWKDRKAKACATSLEEKGKQKAEHQLQARFPNDNMKFSHSIQFNAVPDWSSHYIAYSNLKKL